MLLMLVSSSAFAATWRVDAGGGGDATTIMGAIALAADGDEIVVAPGTYAEDVDLQAKSIVLTGEGGSSVTFVQGTGGGPVVRVDSGETTGTTVRGLTISGGNARESSTTANAGGGLYTRGVPLHAEDLVLTGNDAEYGGGAFFGEADGVEVVSCTFAANTARVGAGAYFYAATATVTDGAWADDVSDLADETSFGGGFAVYGGEVQMEGATIATSQAGVGGGGAYVGGAAVFGCAGCTWSTNAATYGGGLYASDDATVTLRGASFVGNTSASSGGGLTLAGGAAGTAEGLLLQGNTSPYGAGALVSSASLDARYLQAVGNSGVGGGGVYVLGGNVDVALSVFDGNVAADGNGGGVALDGANGTFTNVIFAANTGYSGAGMHVNDGSIANVTNATFTEGTSSSSAGGIRVTSAGTLTLSNTIIAWSRDGSGISGASGSLVLASYTDLYLNEGGATSSGLADPTGTLGNVAVDPTFVTFADDGAYADDLHLDVGSPLIDAGDPALTDADGSRSDIGAYGGPLGASWDAQDVDGDGVTVAAGDCDDTDPAVYPGAADGCDDVDQDCDGVAAEGCDTGGGDDTGETGGGDTGETGGDDTAVDSGADDTAVDSGADDTSGDTAEDSAKGGCGCASSPSPAGFGVALLGAVVALRRRRA